MKSFTCTDLQAAWVFTFYIHLYRKIASFVVTARYCCSIIWISLTSLKLHSLFFYRRRFNIWEMHKNRFLSIFDDLVLFLSNLLTAVFYYLIPSSDDRANNFARGVYVELILNIIETLWLHMWLHMITCVVTSGLCLRVKLRSEMFNTFQRTVWRKWQIIIDAHPLSLLPPPPNLHRC